MRTWKCPTCGNSLEISYDWLAEHGSPVCPKCDCDMELVVVADEIERLAAKADTAGLELADLDELVHETAASIAADANNGGVEEQIKYLVNEMGAESTDRQIDELIESRQKQREEDQ
jgi:hypothetical protein